MVAVALVLGIFAALVGASNVMAQACSGQREANFFAAQRGTTLLLVATGEHPTSGYIRNWTKLSGSKYKFVITPPPTGTIVLQVITPYRSRVRFTAPANLSSVTITEGAQSYTISVTQL
jgi:hypothetical protein